MNCIDRTEPDTFTTQITRIYSAFFWKVHYCFVWTCFYAQGTILDALFRQCKLPIFYFDCTYWTGFHAYWCTAFVTDVVHYFSIRFWFDFNSW